MNDIVHMQNFDCKTPADAANECYQRLIKAIKQIKKGKH